MLALIIFVIACWEKSFWLFLIALSTAFYFYDEKIETLEDRIKDLEDKLQKYTDE